MLGLFAEVVAGPLAGLRWNWDLGVETSETINGESYSYSWSRASLGWAVSYDLIELFGTMFVLDLVPRLNLLDLDTKLPTERVDGTAGSTQFVLENAPGFGIEGALVFATPFFLTRGWAARDVSGIISIGENRSTITTAKGGLDLYWDLFGVADSLDFSLLTFAAVEKISIERDESEVSSELTTTDSESGSKLAYISAFFGLGATLRW